MPGVTGPAAVVSVSRCLVTFVVVLALVPLRGWAQPLAEPLFETPPRRVVSLNVCTDQLAMLLAAPGQLYSVSYLAANPANSALVEQAAEYELNHGLAEQVFLMQPDLVLAGTFSTRATVDMLRRLGFRVEEFAPENSIADIRANVLRMGELLDRSDSAARAIADFDRELDQLRSPPERSRLRAALLFPNGYTYARGTLLDELVRIAGFENVADRLRITGLGRLSLESLILSRPQVLITGQRGRESPALATRFLDHPAFQKIAEDAISVVVPDAYWTCGTPFTIEALEVLVAAHPSSVAAGAESP